jgi:hypothetical protein
MTRHHFRAGAPALALYLFLHATAAMCQDQSTSPSLAGQVVDPTAPLKNYLFQNRYSPSIWGVDDRQNEVTMQAGIPHRLFDMPNIFRITLPYMTSVPSGERGLSDVQIFDVVIYPRSWGNLALGGVASVGPNKGPGINTFAMGPAIGAVLKKNKWTYGVFNQNFFSFGDIATTQIQPILAYTLNDEVSFAIGDAQFTIDWNKGRIVNVPLSGQVNYITHLKTQPLRLFVNTQYNAVNEPGSRKWILALGIAFIVK